MRNRHGPANHQGSCHVLLEEICSSASYKAVGNYDIIFKSKRPMLSGEKYYGRIIVIIIGK